MDDGKWQRKALEEVKGLKEMKYYVRIPNQGKDDGDCHNHKRDSLPYLQQSLLRHKDISLEQEIRFCLRHTVSILLPANHVSLVCVFGTFRQLSGVPWYGIISQGSFN